MTTRKLKTSINRTLLILCSFLIVSCQNPAEAERAFQVFLIGVCQLINSIIFGILSLVFCILSFVSFKPVFKTLGWIFLSFFSLISIWTYAAIFEREPREFDIYILYLAALVIFLISFIFILLKPKANKSQNGDSYLDSIINEKDVL